jgi:hypothetical protein
MRGMKGFAIGKGRRKLDGVEGPGAGAGDGDRDGAGGWGSSSSGSGEEEERMSAGAGKAELGEGGGRTNEVGRSDEAAEVNDGACSGGSTSVSKAGWNLGGDTRDERRDTRVVFRLAPAFPTATTFADGLRGELWPAFLLVDALRGEGGLGVGGSSASIFSTSHERFSSSSFIRSDCPGSISSRSINVSRNGTSKAAFSCPSFKAASVKFLRSSSSCALIFSSRSFSASLTGAIIRSTLVSAMSLCTILGSPANWSNTACVCAAWATDAF